MVALVGHWTSVLKSLCKFLTPRCTPLPLLPSSRIWYRWQLAVHATCWSRVRGFVTSAVEYSQGLQNRRSAPSYSLSRGSERALLLPVYNVCRSIDIRKQNDREHKHNKNLAIENRSRVSCINTNNNIMTLKSGLEVTQCHWMWCHSKV